MAKILTHYEPEEVNPSGRPPDYPWDQWLNGEIWEIVQGVDFHCQTDSMEGLIRRTAANVDIPFKVSVYYKDDRTLVIKPRK